MTGRQAETKKRTSSPTEQRGTMNQTDTFTHSQTEVTPSVPQYLLADEVSRRCVLKVSCYTYFYFPTQTLVEQPHMIISKKHHI